MTSMCLLEWTLTGNKHWREYGGIKKNIIMAASIARDAVN